MSDKDVVMFIIFIPLLILGIISAFKDDKWRHIPPSKQRRRDD